MDEEAPVSASQPMTAPSAGSRGTSQSGVGLYNERLILSLIRRQRSRWGSCSTRGTISLNCCLMFQRPQVVRYLMIHELSHTVQMNHSRRFWQTVSRHCPDYRRLDRELLDGWRRVPSWVFADDNTA